MLLHCDRWRESLAFSIGDEDTGHWQYKMSLHQRLLTVTLDLRGACLRMFLLSFTTDLTDSLVEEIDQKVCCFPQAYALTDR